MNTLGSHLKAAILMTRKLFIDPVVFIARSFIVFVLDKLSFSSSSFQMKTQEHSLSVFVFEEAEESDGTEEFSAWAVLQPR